MAGVFLSVPWYDWYLHVCESWTLTAELQRKEVLPQDTTHLIQRPCYQRGCPCHDPVGNRTTRRPLDYCKKTQAMVLTCVPFIRSGRNHFARHSEREKKTRQTEEEVGRQHQGMDRPGARQVPEGSEKERKTEETGCKVICGAPATLAVEGLVRSARLITDFV